MSIGVIIPTYNRRTSLVYTLQSLAWQTYQDFHVVIAETADGTGRTGQQRSQRLPPIGAGRRLSLDKGSRGRFPEHGRRNLPTGIAVDAG